MRKIRGYEFLGLPSSGKTTAAIMLFDSIEMHVRVCQFSYLFGSHIGRVQRQVFRGTALAIVLFLEPLMSLRLVKHLRWTEQGSLMTFSRLVVQYCCYRFSIGIAYMFYDCYIADEGMLHFIWAVALDSNRSVADVFERLNYLVPKESVEHVHILIDKEQMTARLSARAGNSRFERNPEFRSNGMTNMNLMPSLVKKIPGILFSIKSGAGS